MLEFPLGGSQQRRCWKCFIKAPFLFFCSALRLCLSLSEIPSNAAEGNRLTSSAQDVMVRSVFFETPYIFLAVPLLQIRGCSENY